MDEYTHQTLVFQEILKVYRETYSDCLSVDTNWTVHPGKHKHVKNIAEICNRHFSVWIWIWKPVVTTLYKEVNGTNTGGWQ